MGMTEQCLVRAELVGLDWPLGVQKKAPIASRFEALYGLLRLAEERYGKEAYGLIMNTYLSTAID
jgi:hypothetical protein